MTFLTLTGSGFGCLYCSEWSICSCRVCEVHEYGRQDSVPGCTSLTLCYSQLNNHAKQDGSGEFANKIGLTKDLSGHGLGIRSARYAMFLDDGVIKYLGVDEPTSIEKSGANAIIDFLEKKWLFTGMRSHSAPFSWIKKQNVSWKQQTLFQMNCSNLACQFIFHVF